MNFFYDNLSVFRQSNLWMDKIALKTFTSNSRKLSWRKFYNCCTWIHCSLRKQECRHESEIYNYRRIQFLNIKLIMESWGVSLTWLDCHAINIPAAKRLSVGWAAATQNLSCSLLKVWTPVLKRKHMKNLHNSTKWTHKYFSAHLHVHF